MNALMDMGLTVVGTATATLLGYFMGFTVSHRTAIYIMPHMDAIPITATDTTAMDMEVGGDIMNGGGQMEIVTRMILQIMIIV